MKERPILFSAPMVRALLGGSKTQTRRIVKMTENDFIVDRCGHDGNEHMPPWPVSGGEDWMKSPYGQPGDRLWVRETHSPYLIGCENDIRNYVRVKYKADESIQEIDISREIYDHLDKKDMHREWVPSIHMFRWASRINLEIITVRVERLQDISEDDAEAEGVEPPDAEREERDFAICPQCGGTGLYDTLGANLGVIPDCDCLECNTYAKRYKHLWESINGPGSWDLNPWVWVIEFKRVAK